MARAARPALPTGTVTYLFSDIEGSTSLLAVFGDRYLPLLERHAQLLRDAFAANDGIEVNTEGDAFFAVFVSADQAVAAAAAAQAALAAEGWPTHGVIRVRIGIHSGEGRLGGADYVGLDVNRAARIAAAAHGGQVVLSDATRELVERGLPAHLTLHDLGRHRLKDLPDTEQLWQLDIEGLPSRFPALRTLDARATNLPPEPSPLIGRDDELATARELLGQRRLLTLTGPGGTGKTRLGLAVAASLLAEQKDDVFVVDLQDAGDTVAVAAAIAEAIGVRERADRGPEETVAAYLRERPCLLLLDNFEQVIGSAPFVGRLLEASPGLRVIVTSREALRLRGEQELPVQPLPLPAPGTAVTLEGAADSPAVQLFVQRAREVRPDFELSEANTGHVLEIVRRVDGLPLAIELAAARVRLLSPEAILSRLEQSLAVLSGGGRDRPDRQQTLRGAIDWSYRLLDDADQRLFARLSVFAGGWNLASAEAVCLEGSSYDELFEPLASLGERSLIRASDEPSREPRFDMLRVIHEFAAERLAEGPERDQIARRHATWAADLAERAEPELTRSALREWQDRLFREQENLRAALRWAIEHKETGLGLRTAGPLWRFWHYRGAAREGREWLEAVLVLPGAEEAGPDRARALAGLAGLVYWQGDLERAARLYGEALAIRRAAADPHEVAEALRDGTWPLFGTGRLSEARTWAREAIEIYRDLGDDPCVIVTEAWLAMTATISGSGGKIEEAIALAQRAAQASRVAGKPFEEADWLSSLAYLERERGDLEAALVHGRQALRAFYDLGALGWVGSYFKLFAAMELKRGGYERAVTLGTMAARFSEAFGGELPDSMLRAGDPVTEAAPFLDPKVHARAVAEGQRMPLDEAAAYALEE